MGGFFGGSGTGSGSGAGFGTKRATAALPAGASNNLNPGGGWPGGFGRLILTAGAGAANLTGLLAGADGQPVVLMNNDPVNTITLNSLNAGSVAANQFDNGPGPGGDLVLTPGQSVLLMYDSTLGKWLIA